MINHATFQHLTWPSCNHTRSLHHHPPLCFSTLYKYHEAWERSLLYTSKLSRSLIGDHLWRKASLSLNTPRLTQASSGSGSGPTRITSTGQTRREMGSQRPAIRSSRGRRELLPTTYLPWKVSSKRVSKTASSGSRTGSPMFVTMYEIYHKSDINMSLVY